MRVLWFRSAFAKATARHFRFAKVGVRGARSALSSLWWVALIVSNQRRALRAPRFAVVFSRRWDEESPSARCFQGGVSASRLSSVPSSPVLVGRTSAVLDSAVSLPADFSLISAKHRFDRFPPTVSAHSKVSELFEISRVRRRHVSAAPDRSDGFRRRA